MYVEELLLPLPFVNPKWISVVRRTVSRLFLEVTKFIYGTPPGDSKRGIYL